MPELPEVETIARGLHPVLVGRTITSIAHQAGHLKPALQGEPSKNLPGKTILDVGRRGKLLLLELSESEKLVFHLRMTGRLGLMPVDQPPGPHIHLMLNLDSAITLFFQDQRKFGTCRHFAPDELDSWPFYSQLGPEPLTLTRTQFQRCLQGRRGRIKGALLDQKVIAGIGNIYADESLFRAGIHPAACVADLNKRQLTLLFKSVQDVLREAITAGGSSIRDYRTAAGLVGSFQDAFQVYGRKSLPCPQCGLSIQTVKVAGRTSSFCPSCQKV